MSERNFLLIQCFFLSEREVKYSDNNNDDEL